MRLPHRRKQSLSSRHKNRTLLFASCFAVGSLLFSSATLQADPLAITYSVQQTAASTWTYQYFLSGSLGSGDDVVIRFPLATSSSLQDQSQTGQDFTSFVLQPDPALPADGELDLIASASNPNLSQTFAATFTFSGAGTPGSQAFTLYDPSFATLATGQTSPFVAPAATPEGSSLGLVATGVLSLIGLGRRRFQARP